MANLWSSIRHNLKKEKLMTISNLTVMTVTFLLLGVFIYVIVFSQTALKYLEQQAQLTIFFKDSFPENNIMSFKNQISTDARISDVKYVSKEDALKIFKEMNKNEPILLESVSASVLPASLEIKSTKISDLKSLSDEFQKRDGVEEVRFFEDVIGKFMVWSNSIYVIGFILVFAFFLISYSVIIASLRNTINAKGVELEIMKLVGASDNYVRKPFIYQGVFFGLVSSSIAAILNILVGIGLSTSQSFPKGLSLGFIPNLFISPFVFSIILAVVLIISGFLLGYFGSSAALKKYLKY